MFSLTCSPLDSNQSTKSPALLRPHTQWSTLDRNMMTQKDKGYTYTQLKSLVICILTYITYTNTFLMSYLSQHSYVVSVLVFRWFINHYWMMLWWQYSTPPSHSLDPHSLNPDHFSVSVSSHSLFFTLSKTRVSPHWTPPAPMNSEQHCMRFTPQ